MKTVFLTTYVKKLSPSLFYFLNLRLKIQRDKKNPEKEFSFTNKKNQTRIKKEAKLNQDKLNARK